MMLMAVEIKIYFDTVPSVSVTFFKSIFMQFIWITNNFYVTKGRLYQTLKNSVGDVQAPTRATKCIVSLLGWAFAIYNRFQVNTQRFIYISLSNSGHITPKKVTHIENVILKLILQIDLMTISSWFSSS